MNPGEAAHRQTGEVYTLTEQEKEWLGLKKPAPLKGTIHISIPVHYGGRALMWVDRFVTEGQLEGYKEQYPNLQIIERRDLAR